MRDLIERIFITPGRWLTLAATWFPLSTRFLDEDYRVDERQHLLWALSFWGFVAAVLAVLLTR